MEKSFGESREPNNFAVLLTFLAGGLMIAMGLIVMIYGFFGLLGEVGRGTETPIQVSRNVWDVIRLVGGFVLFSAGINVFVGKFWARIVAIVAALLFLLGGLANIDPYPVFALGLVILNIFILWAIYFHWHEVSFD